MKEYERIQKIVDLHNDSVFYGEPDKSARVHSLKNYIQMQ